MKINRKFVLQLLSILFGIVGGYLFYYFVSIELIKSLLYLDNISGISIYICHILFFYLVCKIFFRLRVTKVDKSIAVILYFILLYIAFFDRFNLGRRVITFNPFDLSGQTMITTLLNIMIFLPFYTILRWTINSNHMKRYFFIWLLAALLIETIQYIFMIGIFDFTDIILYLIGYLLGIKLYHCIFNTDKIKTI